ncbi:hypothetical protein G5714_018219 [Onychostoma macrolepis]|uniref:Uncharacterized protein n=1 Tax=Onychostoma macrolepis TaxID=369639 RepID=A0A7J6BZS5_9TELE|nr:hypothetical protein G5714_018219 [Onychostoma macrolepis]
MLIWRQRGCSEPRVALFLASGGATGRHVASAVRPGSQRLFVQGHSGCSSRVTAAVRPGSQRLFVQGHSGCSSRVTAAVRPGSQQHVSADLPDTPRSSRSVFHYPSLMSSLRDVPLVSAHTAGIPKPTHSNPPVLMHIPLSEALPLMGIALCCVWAAYTTAELPEVATPAVASPEVAVHAAEPPEAAGLASAPCMVVAPSNALSLCPEFTTAEPPEVSAVSVN